MTIFDNNTQQTPPTVTIEEGKYLESLVGEGKKFKDAEALARGKAESDAFIVRLQAETEDLRNELKTRLNLEDAIAEIKRGASNVPSNPPAHQPGEETPPTSNTPPQNKQLSQEEIDVLLERKLNQRQEQTRAQQNQELSERELTRAWGANAGAQLKDVARDLGMTLDQLKAIAGQNPKAFLKLVGAEVKRDLGDYTPPRTSVDAPRGTSGSTKNDKYYKDMLRTNPSQYWDKNTQLEIYKEAMAQGEKFYS